MAVESINYNATFDDLTARIVDGTLCFCDQVVEELNRTAESEPGALWVATVKRLRQHSGAAMATIRWVTQNVPRLIDPGARNDAAPYVLAQARSLDQDGHKVAIVTEDLHDKPTRRALSDACDHLQIPWLQVPEWTNQCGINWP